jgi:hypothetical protein
VTSACAAGADKVLGDGGGVHARPLQACGLVLVRSAVLPDDHV